MAAPHIPTAREFLARATSRKLSSQACGYIFRSAREHQPPLSNFEQLKMVCDLYIMESFEKGDDEAFVAVREPRLPAVKDEDARQQIFDHYSSPELGYKVEISRLNETSWYFTFTVPEAATALQVELTGEVKLEADGTLVAKTVTTTPPIEFIV